jgi:hypothetical protein
MLEELPIDLIVEIGILAGPDEYEQIAKISERNAIILRKPYITRATNVLIVSKFEMTYKGRLHSFGDQPASITEIGTYWYRYGKLHRDNDQPAAIRANGDKYWYQHGKYHRDNDQPAIIFVSGYQEWFQYGLYHRGNDQPAIISSDGTKEWYHHGNRIK